MKIKDIRPNLGLWVVISILISLVVCFYPTLISYWVPAAADRGVFGDSFGALNTLFTGLAFSGVIITILMQRNELKNQREHNELQRFENLIFMMINLHLDIIDKLEFLSDKRRDVFRAYLNAIKDSSKELQEFSVLSKLSLSQLNQLSTLSSEEEVVSLIESSNKSNISIDEVNILKEVFKSKHTSIPRFESKDHDVHIGVLKAAIKESRKIHRNVLSHYFRNLHNILDSIDQAEFLDKNAKIKLVGVVKCQLSNDELLAILYNSIVEINEETTGVKAQGYPNLTRLACKYNLTNSIDEINLIHAIHREIYKKAGETVLKEAP